MRYKVKEVADMVGITIRMLHHYDKIGLLKPQSVNAAGYRLYSDSDLERLQQVLFFKELDFSLNQIKELLDDPGFDRHKALKSHRQLLLEKKKRLESIIKTVDRTIQAVQGGTTMKTKEMFDGFDMRDIEAHKEKYAKEVEEKYGHSDAYKECAKKTASYKSEQWKEIKEKNTAIFDKIVSLMDKGPADAEVQEAVGAYRQYITDYFYTCTPEIFRGLGDMYITDQRFTKNLNKHGEGFAAFMKEAMGIYCDNL
ncbi:MerR family transcriptional regulator [Vallitalea pronyensis]|uniref:MerR family transcriptional regulator n=1 Tax=Vallitalea pronyensis TaxID=1348613 RepID=A0A8J8MJJ7_9FIRM|nr:MerR family transcriptional regulator [Vallitalea pronyensis]QUI22597.1 MerR family transcriptional regulator [Vallitalea pronyensis]